MSRTLDFFRRLSSVPHGSGNTKAISDICVSIAKEFELKYYQDNLNNVIMYKDATAGYENAEPVMMQAHLDMVCVKKDDCDIDFSTQQIKILEDDKYIFADGTSLGADDLAGAAIMMDILTDNKAEHPALEAIFTVDEEIGMFGAKDLDYNKLNSHRLINLDSEELDIITVGCAGGERLNGIIPVEWEYCDEPVDEYSVTGLPGGHSGVMIGIEGYDNAAILLAKKLLEIPNLRLSYFKSGLFDNAIPDSAYANAGGRKVITKSSTQNILKYLTTVPDGLIKWSEHFEGLQQTSLNLGIVELKEDGLHVSHLLRSAINEEKEVLDDQVKECIEEAGGTWKIASKYGAWEYKEDSALRGIARDVYREELGIDPVFQATHGGLECGIICEHIRGLDCISIGPNVLDVHTYSERLEKESVEQVNKAVRGILKRLKS